jgi:hypothetical protein
MSRIRGRRLFAIGLGVRLLGVLLIWLGDGSSLLWRKAVVAVGIVLTVGGIGVLRYLLFRRRPAAVAND